MASRAYSEPLAKATVVFASMANAPRCWSCSLPLKSIRQGRTRRGQICTKCKQKLEKCPGCGDTIRLGKLVAPQCNDVRTDKDIFWVCRWCEYQATPGEYYTTAAPQSSSQRFSGKMHVWQRHSHPRDCRA